MIKSKIKINLTEDEVNVMKTSKSRVILNIIIPILILLLLFGVFPNRDIKTASDVVLLILQIFTPIIITYILVMIMMSINSSEEIIFTKINVKRFRIIGYMFIILVVFEYIRTIVTGQRYLGYAIDLGFPFYITGSMCFIMIPGLLCFLIADSFQKAINIKEENDLTI